MTTVEFIKKIKEQIDYASVDTSELQRGVYFGRASVFVDFALAQAEADAEALKDALTLADLATMDQDTARGNLSAVLDEIQKSPVQLIPVGVKE